MNDCWVCHTPLTAHGFLRRFMHRWVMRTYGDEDVWRSSRG